MNPTTELCHIILGARAVKRTVVTKVRKGKYF